MRRRTVVLACAVALAGAAPLGIADAQTQQPAEPGAAEPGAAEPGTPDVDEPVEESPTGSYIVVMRDAPLVADIPREQLDAPVAQAAAAELDAEQDDVLAEEGIAETEKVQGYTSALNGFSATLSHDEAQRLSTNPKVAKVVPDELRQLDTETNVEYLGLTSRGGAWEAGITGEGVVVGVIDSGIWPEHPSFADDGSYAVPPVTLEDTAALPACEFGNTAHHPADAPFTCNDKLIGARQMLTTYRAVFGAEPDEFDSARDDDGHGTHTAGIAAGNADVDAQIYDNDLGSASGVAPRAHVIAYKAVGPLGGFTSDLVSAIDQAVRDGVDVINYSVGGGAGLDRADAISFLFAADAGIFVATSAGNSGDGAGTIDGPGDAPWVTAVAASTHHRFWAGTAVLSDAEADAQARGGHGWRGWFEWWKHWNDTELVKVDGASITPGTGHHKLPLVDAELAGGDLCIPGTLDPAAVEGAIVLCRRGAIDRAAKSSAVYQAGGAGMILYNNSDADSLFTDNHWVPSVHMDHSDGMIVKQHIADTDEPTAKIRDGARETHVDGGPSILRSSARGPNPSSSDVVKPDLTAPGLQIVAGHTPMPIGGVPTELFQARSGTSMSSPHVAGLFALLAQAHPDWSAAAARSALMTTADEHVLDTDGSDADPFDTGSGHVDPGGVHTPGSAFDPGLVYEAGYVDYLGFLCDAQPALLADPVEICATLDEMGVPTDASDLNYPSIAVGELAGSQTVVRTIKSVADATIEWEASIDPPDGYDVSVTPNRVQLAPGESATVEITITEAGAPVGEWRDGSLTWTGGHHVARSPIAVRGTSPAVPAVTGAAAGDTTGLEVATRLGAAP